MLERVVPLMDHPSDTFLSTLDERLGLLIRDKGMVIIASAVACMSASFKKWRKPKPAICEIFLLYLSKHLVAFKCKTFQISYIRRVMLVYSD